MLIILWLLWNYTLPGFSQKPWPQPLWLHFLNKQSCHVVYNHVSLLDIKTQWRNTVKKIKVCILQQHRWIKTVRLNGTWNLRIFNNGTITSCPNFFTSVIIVKSNLRYLQSPALATYNLFPRNRATKAAQPPSILYVTFSLLICSSWQKKECSTVMSTTTGVRLKYSLVPGSRFKEV